MTSNDITSIESVAAADLKGKRVLVRCDFNVAVADDGRVIDDLRIRKTIPTIELLRKAGARLVLVSHIEGKSAGLSGGIDSLEPVARHIQAAYESQFGKVTFIKNFLDDSTLDAVNSLQEGEVVLFENVRTDAGEKKNDPALAARLARYADIYVNDAFAVSHRSHASVVALPALLPHYAGIQLMSEISHLSAVFDPQHPFVFILGGAKFDTKLPLIQKFMMGERSADFVFLGGALLNNVLKEKGYSVGKSLVSEGDFDLASVVDNPKLVIPSDVVVSSPEGTSVRGIEDVGADDSIMDAGPSMTAKLQEVLVTAKFVLWNGPMGAYEMGFKEQTIAMAQAVANSGVQAAVGGGDTTAAMAELGYDDEAMQKAKAPSMFISTGGGAMIEFLLNETLPGIEALK